MVSHRPPSAGLAGPNLLILLVNNVRTTTGCGGGPEILTAGAGPHVMCAWKRQNYGP